MRLDKAIHTRKSVRKFSSKKPNWRDIIECIDASRFAPMAGGNHTTKFILIDDKEKIQKIANICQQDFISKAYYIVIAISNPKRTLNAYGKRGERYVRQQAGAAIENFLLKIEEKKLSSCWVGHFVDEQIKEILSIPEEYYIEAILPIGYESQKPKTRRAKIELDQILYFNKHGNKKMKSEKKLSA